MVAAVGRFLARHLHFASPTSSSMRDVEPDFETLPGDAVVQVKSQGPTVEIPVGAAFDIRKPISTEALDQELQKQIRLVLRTSKWQAKPLERVAVVFRVREGNSERLRSQLLTALKGIRKSTYLRNVRSWYLVVDPNVTREEAVERFDRATGGRGQVKARHVDAALTFRTTRPHTEK